MLSLLKSSFVVTVVGLFGRIGVRYTLVGAPTRSSRQDHMDKSLTT